jgi:DNA ligase-1
MLPLYVGGEFLMEFEPMLLADTKEAFEDDRYIAELKLDGIRAVAEIDHHTRIYTRHNNEITFKFPEIVSGVKAAVPKGTVLDGELIVSDPDGKPNFEAMMRRFMQNRTPAPSPGLTFVAFDILKKCGEDVRRLPLMDRKELLEQTLRENDLIKRIRYVDPFYSAVERAALEGIVLKLRNSRYYSGARRDVWQRVVCYSRETVFVTGYSRKKLAWSIALKEDDRLIPVGVVEYGLTETVRKRVFPLLQRKIIRETRDFVFVEPHVQIGVRFRNWTSTGKMRLAVLEYVV